MLRVFSACAYINKITWIIKSVNLKRICCATFVKHPHSVWALRSKVMFFEFSLLGDLAFSSQCGWGSSGDPHVQPRAQVGPPQGQDCVQVPFEYPWQRRCPNLSGRPVLVLPSLWWKCLLMFRGSLLCFSLFPLPLVPPLGLALSLHSLLRYLCVRSPPGLLQVYQSQLSQFSSQERFSTVP